MVGDGTGRTCWLVLGTRVTFLASTVSEEGSHWRVWSRGQTWPNGLLEESLHVCADEKQRSEGGLGEARQ